MKGNGCKKRIFPNEDTRVRGQRAKIHHIKMIHLCQHGTWGEKRKKKTVGGERGTIEQEKNASNLAENSKNVGKGCSQRKEKHGSNVS